MHPVSTASVNAELREDHLALVMSTKKLCDELKKNQKYQINVRDNPRNDENCSSFINTAEFYFDARNGIYQLPPGEKQPESLLERMEKLERIALNLVKCVEFQYDIIWGPAPAENGVASIAAVHESAVGRKTEDTVDGNSMKELNSLDIVRRTPKLLKPVPLSVNRSDLSNKEKPKLMLLKPVVDVRGISRDVGSALQPAVGVSLEESREIDTLSLSDSQLAKPRLVRPGLGKANTSPTPTVAPVYKWKDTSCDELIECLTAVFADPGSFESTSKHLMALASEIRNVEDVKKVAIAVYEFALQHSEFTLLGANISEKFHQANPSYRNQLIEHCQGEFVKLIASVGKGSEHEIHAAKFLGFLAQLYIHIGNKASGRIKIFPIAIVELLRNLLGLEGSDLLKENLVCARELLQLMKPILMEEPNPSLFEELTKLKAQCDKLKANGCMNAELKRHLLVTNSAAVSILNGLKNAN